MWLSAYHESFEDAHIQSYEKDYKESCQFLAKEIWEKYGRGSVVFDITECIITSGDFETDFKPVTIRVVMDVLKAYEKYNKGE
jgi:hypothetical protein